MEKYISITLSIKELRPGFILNEDLNLGKDLKTGHVLSPSDVDFIQSTQIKKVSILRIDDTPVIPDSTIPHLKFRHQRPSIQADNFLSYLTDQKHSKEIQHFNRLYIEDFRGSDDVAYQDEKYEYFFTKFELNDNPDFNRNRSDGEESLKSFIRSHRDIAKLKSMNPLKLEDMLQKIGMYEEVFDLFFQTLLEDRVRFTSVMDSVMLELAMDFAQIPTRSLLALFSEHYTKSGFFVHHSFQVCLLSIILAIETTHLLHEKTEFLLKNDIKTFIRITKKVYNLEDIIKLGIAALLHDIDFMKKIPDLNANMQFDAKHFSIIDLHPSNGYQLAKMLGLDFEIQSAIYQHHERYDGTGYPHNVSPHLFTKYTPVLMFAEYYIEYTTINPFNSVTLSPRKTVIQLLTQHRHLLDGDVLMSFLRAASLFPVGTWVQLSDSNIGLVYDVNPDALESPMVRILYNQQMQPIEPDNIDLRIDGRKITETVRSSVIQRLLQSPHPQMLNV